MMYPKIYDADKLSLYTSPSCTTIDFAKDGKIHAILVEWSNKDKEMFSNTHDENMVRRHERDLALHKRDIFLDVDMPIGDYIHRKTDDGIDHIQLALEIGSRFLGDPRPVENIYIPVPNSVTYGSDDYYLIVHDMKLFSPDGQDVFEFTLCLSPDCKTDIETQWEIAFAPTTKIGDKVLCLDNRSNEFEAVNTSGNGIITGLSAFNFYWEKAKEIEKHHKIK